VGGGPTGHPAHRAVFIATQFRKKFASIEDVDIFELARLNLTNPAVIAFALGVLVAIVKGDLRLPEQVASFVSTFLLLAIGLKGGIALRQAAAGDVLVPALGTVALGAATAAGTFFAARWFIRLDVSDAASLAAHYGSVSAVTFTAAMAFADSAGFAPDGMMPALVAILEVPGIILALLFARSGSNSKSLRAALHEVFTGKSVLLLLGGLFIGRFASEAGIEQATPFFVGLFPGMLVIFLLDLGTMAGKRLADVRQVGARLVVWAVVAPLVFGSIGAVVGTIVGLSVGGAAVMATMAASASYIAAPAAVRVGIPSARPAVSLGAAIGITFPFNLIVGIPIYLEIAKGLG
jgi:hypothetical protein